MSAGFEVTTLDAVIDQATPAQRRYLVEKLLPKVIEEDRYWPKLVRNAKGELIGVLIPEFRSKATEPPKLSAERERELQRRLDSLDKVVTHEQLLKDLGLADIQVPRRL